MTDRPMTDATVVRYSLPRYITDAVTAEEIHYDDYLWGYCMTCADCGEVIEKGRHETIFDRDLPEMFAANHAHCGDRPL